MTAVAIASKIFALADVHLRHCNILGAIQCLCTFRHTEIVTFPPLIEAKGLLCLGRLLMTFTNELDMTEQALKRSLAICNSEEGGSDLDLKLQAHEAYCNFLRKKNIGKVQSVEESTLQNVLALAESIKHENPYWYIQFLLIKAQLLITNRRHRKALETLQEADKYRSSGAKIIILLLMYQLNLLLEDHAAAEEVAQQCESVVLGCERPYRIQYLLLRTLHFAILENYKHAREQLSLLKKYILTVTKQAETGFTLNDLMNGLNGFSWLHPRDVYLIIYTLEAVCSMEQKSQPMYRDIELHFSKGKKLYDSIIADELTDKGSIAIAPERLQAIKKTMFVLLQCFIRAKITTNTATEDIPALMQHLAQLGGDLNQKGVVCHIQFLTTLTDNGASTTTYDFALLEEAANHFAKQNETQQRVCCQLEMACNLLLSSSSTIEEWTHAEQQLFSPVKKDGLRSAYARALYELTQGLIFYRKSLAMEAKRSLALALQIAEENSLAQVVVHSLALIHRLTESDGSNSNTTSTEHISAEKRRALLQTAQTIAATMGDVHMQSELSKAAENGK